MFIIYDFIIFFHPILIHSIYLLLGICKYISLYLLYANIEKECVIIGANDRIEIWSKENWDTFNAEYGEELESIAEHLFNGGD